MITTDQLSILNVVPRGKHACCVPAAIAFTTGSNYFDVEEVIQREQPSFRPDLKTSDGVLTVKLLGKQRRLFGHIFTKIDFPVGITVNLFRHINQTGTYLVRRHRHALVIREGKIYDWMDSTKHVILDVWKVEKA